MTGSDFESQFRRIFEATECRTQLKLAEFLDIRQSSISDAKRRQTIPAEWLLKIFDKKGIPPDWIRTGMAIRRARRHAQPDRLRQSLPKLNADPRKSVLRMNFWPK